MCGEAAAEIRPVSRAEWPSEASLDDGAVRALQEARLDDVARTLGCQALKSEAGCLVVVRIWHPSLERDLEREGLEVLLRPSFAAAWDEREHEPVALVRRAPRLYEGVLALFAPLKSADELYASLRYEVVVPEGDCQILDAYALGTRTPCLLSEGDVDQLQSGVFPGIADALGCHSAVIEGSHAQSIAGLRFAVWAPRAVNVSVVGDWNEWDGRTSPMYRRCRGSGGGFTGLWELFVPFGAARSALPLGSHYGFEVRGPSGEITVRIDPFAQEFEAPPVNITSAPLTNSSKVSQFNETCRAEPFPWNDGDWLRERDSLGECGMLLHKPMATYEVHLPSWRRRADGGFLNYREIAPLLLEHVQAMNFNYIEIMGLAHHPFYGSWGYQVSGYYACYSLLGTPDDFRYLVDTMHQAGIGVLMDFVPAHFCKDACSFANFDGTATFEYEDPREGEQRDWGTKVFNFRRNEVRSFLIGAVLFWAKQYHLDGFRCDAVSSMLYRNFCSRDGFKRDGEWIPNEYGGNANLEVVSFFRALNKAVHERHPGVIMIAEESHAWGGVTWEEREHSGGLGFDLKWDLGWMNDTLTYFEQPPHAKANSHGKLTRRELMAERWVVPLSHDEVTAQKGSLLEKMGKHGHMEFYDKLRLMAALFGYQTASVGRPLLFMGAEIGQGGEWNHHHSVDWHEGSEPLRQKLCVWVSDILAVYRHHPPLHAGDDGDRSLGGRDSYECLESNAGACVLAFVRRYCKERPVFCVFNFGWQEHRNYCFCAPHYGEWEVLVNSDDPRYGGRGCGPGNLARLHTGQGGRPGWSDCLWLDVPAHGCVMLLGPRDPDSCRCTGTKGMAMDVGPACASEVSYLDEAYELGF